MENIIKWIINLFSGLISTKYGKELIVFIVSLMPLLELRGGLIAASPTLLNVEPIKAYIISIIGNVLPVPFILLFINKIIKWMGNSRIKLLNKMASWLDKKARKNKNKIAKYGYFGLVLFVGIPIPGTGAWTGCLAASVLEMDRKKSFFAIMLGILMASIIMMIFSYGILGNLFK
jgi:uncharacterized membrane protein